MADRDPEKAAANDLATDPHRQPAAEEHAEEQYDSSSLEKNERDDATAAPVEKSLSKMSANNVAAVPNGGLTAWLQVVGAWVLLFNTWGLLNTFGVYQEYYESGQLFTSTSSNISWIGSIQSFLLLFIGALTGPVFDAGYLRLLLVLGSFLVVFGHMMLSLVHEYWQALLAQAFCIGLGAGCLFIPSMAILSQYFTTRISTAIGIAVSGSSLGGVIYPIMFQRLVQEIGFPWAVRVIGFMALAMLIVPCTLMKMRVKPAAKRALFDASAFKEAPYSMFIFSGFFGYTGLLIPFFYISFFTSAERFADTTLSFYVLPIANAASIFGRLVPSIIADRTGTFNMLIPAAMMTTIIAFALISVHNFGGVVTAGIFYGFFSGTYVSLPPSIIVGMTPANKRYLIGTRMGMAFTIMGLGVLMGSPVAGAILGDNNYFTGIWIWSGACLGVSFIGFTVVRFLMHGPRLFVKA